MKAEKKTAPLHTSLRMLCTDFDNTIAEPGDAPISPDFFQHLIRMRQKGPFYWVINTGRTLESLVDDLIVREAPIWPDWAVTVEREIWRIRDRRGIGWLEWNRKCEIMHNQLFASVQPFWKAVQDYVIKHTQGKLVNDAGSPFGIIASCEEEADEIYAYVLPLLRNWPMLTAVRNSIYFRFSHKFYNKGSCLEAISSGLGISPLQILAVGDHLNDLPMLERRYAHHLACPANAVDEVKKKIRAQGGYVASADVAEGTIEAWDRLLPVEEPENA